MKFIRKEELEAFIINHESMTREEIKNDEVVKDIIEDRKKCIDIAKSLGTDTEVVYRVAEGYLYLFEHREEYEICAKIRNNWEELALYFHEPVTV